MVEVGGCLLVCSFARSELAQPALGRLGGGTRRPQSHHGPLEAQAVLIGVYDGLRATIQLPAEQLGASAIARSISALRQHPGLILLRCWRIALVRMLLIITEPTIIGLPLSAVCLPVGDPGLTLAPLGLRPSLLLVANFHIPSITRPPLVDTGCLLQVLLSFVLLLDDICWVVRARTILKGLNFVQVLEELLGCWAESV